MIPLTLTMPRLGETMEEGVIVTWLVAPGESFSRGQPILELETDKTAVEFPALGAGVIDEILAEPGTGVAVGAPIARARVAAAAEWAEVSGATDTGAGTEAETEVVDLSGQAFPGHGAPSPAGPAPGERPRATPVARRLARERGIALESLRGSGRRGRIERADVESAGTLQEGGAALQTGAAELLLQGGRLGYEIRGTGGETFVLIHGFAGDRSAWALLAGALVRAGQSVVSLDLPGHGATTLAAQDTASLTGAVVALAKMLPGPLVLVGHSLGAAVAVGAAGQLPGKVGRLVLLTPAGCGPQIGADFILGMAGATTPGEVADLLRRLGPKGGALSEAALGQMAGELAKGRLQSLAGSLVSAAGEQRLDILPALEPLAQQLPVMAVFGTQDRIVAATDALNLPFRVGVHFMTTGHMPQWDAPRALAELIVKPAACSPWAKRG